VKKKRGDFMNLGEIKKSVSKNYVNMGKDKLKVG